MEAGRERPQKSISISLVLEWCKVLVPWESRRSSQVNHNLNNNSEWGLKDKGRTGSAYRAGSLQSHQWKTREKLIPKSQIPEAG